jgi:hypothetical protein
MAVSDYPFIYPSMNRNVSPGIIGSPNRRR